MIYNIIWYILLPFIAIYKMSINSMWEMSDFWKFVYLILLVFVLIQIAELLEYLI